MQIFNILAQKVTLHSKVMPFLRKKITIKDPKTGKSKRKLGIIFNCETCDFEIKVPKLK